MAIEIRGHGQVVRISEKTWNVSLKEQPGYKTSVISGIIKTDLPDYDGAYEVVPDADGQELGTANRTLRQDVTIHPIPYLETTNEAGGYTVSIAS